MAINKKKAAEAESSAKLTIEVKKAHDFSKEDTTTIAFDMVVNGELCRAFGLCCLLLVDSHNSLL